MFGAYAMCIFDSLFPVPWMLRKLADMHETKTKEIRNKEKPALLQQRILTGKTIAQINN